LRKSWPSKLTPLERKLGLRFKNRDLLQQATIHPSYVNELRPARSSLDSYERLEFLGDSKLNLDITLEIFNRCPTLSEGELTKLRSSLVRGSTLARVARGLELGGHLKLGKGEESTGGRDRDSNLAAAFEALVGAVLMDRGPDHARKFVLKKMEAELEGALAQGVPEDPKSRLQELVQKMGRTPPQYRLVASDGPEHSKRFDVEVVIGGQVVGRGEGTRKSDAEKQAAQAAFRSLEDSGTT
jgi:ribonuclease-3